MSPAEPILCYPDTHGLIASTRAGILASGVPGWIENVASSRVPFTGFWVMLCGSMFPETYHLKRHRRFELLRWKIPQPWHNDALCRYGSDAHDAASCALCADFGASDTRRVAVAGKGPQGGLDGPREVVTLSDGSGLRGAGRDGKQQRFTMAVVGHGMGGERYKRLRETLTVTANANCDRGSNRGGGWEKEKAKRDVVSVIGTNGSTPAFGGDKERRAAFRAGRTCVGVFGGAMDGPGQLLGQNRAGPEAIRWRIAMGWEDGPQDRYALSQAVPPCYAEWLGRRFLSEIRECAAP